MKNIDRIWLMPAEELARFLNDCGCSCCAFENDIKMCNEKPCSDGIQKWLEEEEEEK